MSAFQDNIQNLSAVLDILHSGARASHQPVLQLVANHLRLPASLAGRNCHYPCCPAQLSCDNPAKSPTLTISGLLPGEARHDQ